MQLSTSTQGLSSSTQGLSSSLKTAIKKSGLSNYALSGLTGVDQSVLNRFMAGSRDITLDTASKIAAALGGELKFRKGKVPA